MDEDIRGKEITTLERVSPLASALLAFILSFIFVPPYLVYVALFLAIRPALLGKTNTAYITVMLALLTLFMFDFLMPVHMMFWQRISLALLFFAVVAAAIYGGYCRSKVSFVAALVFSAFIAFSLHGLEIIKAPRMVALTYFSKPIELPDIPDTACAQHPDSVCLTRLAAQKSNKQDSVTTQINLFIKIAELLLDLRKDSEAKDYLIEAYYLSKEMDHNFGLARHVANIAERLAAIGEVKTASQYLFEVKNKILRQEWINSYQLSVIALAYRKIGDANASRELFDMAVDINRERKDYRSISDMAFKQVAAGDYRGAIRTALAIEDSNKRDRTLSMCLAQIANRGELELVSKYIGYIENESSKSLVEERIEYQNIVHADDVNNIVVAANVTSDVEETDKSLWNNVSRLAQNGQYSQALELIDHIEDPAVQSYAINGVVKYGAGDMFDEKGLEKLLSQIRNIRDANKRLRAIHSLTWTHIYLGKWDKVRELLSFIEQEVNDNEMIKRDFRLMGSLATVMGYSGEYDRAYNLMPKNVSKYYQSEQQGNIIRNIAKVGSYDEAILQAEKLDSYSLLRDIALIQLLDGDSGASKTIELSFDKALHLTNRPTSLDSDNSRDKALATIAPIQVLAGEPSKALKTLNMISSYYEKRRAYHDAAVASVIVGNKKEATQIALMSSDAMALVDTAAVMGGVAKAYDREVPEICVIKSIYLNKEMGFCKQQVRAMEDT